MPCLNEARTLEVCIRKAQSFLDGAGVAGEVVIADNGSTDGSQELARACGARLVEVPVRGYGAALAEGSRQARGRYIIMGDSDDSYDFLHLMPFVEALRAGNDLVMGNRFLGGIKSGAMPWKNRWLGNPVLSALGKLLFRTPVGDFHCGLRGYRADAFRRMDLRTTGMEFASEMVMKATLLQMRVVEVPTTLSPDGRGRAPHLRPWRDGWRHLRFMLLYSPRWLFLYPGLAMMGVGVLLTVALLFGRIWIGPVSLDVHTMLYASALILIGFQSAMFSLYSKIFAIAEGLLPADTRVSWLHRHFTLETGLVAGSILFLLGTLGSVLAVVYWGRHSFGEINPEALLRLVVPSVLAMTLGVQIVLSGFFLSLLMMRRRA
jgi:glycosyltransferase involved in cell wall biosynthesis